MRISLRMLVFLVSYGASLLLSLPWAHSSEPDIGEIEGEWLSEGFVDRISRLKQTPYDSARAGEDAAELRIFRRAGSYVIQIGNYHEADDVGIESLTARTRDRWSIGVSRSVSAYEMGLYRDVSGRVVSIATDAFFGRLRRYVRMEHGIREYVNSQTIAGSYRKVASDHSLGESIEIRVDGTMSWGSEERSYSVELDASERGCSTFHIDPPLEGLSGMQTVGYKRSGDRLMLYRIRVDDGQDTGFPINCSSEPFVVLAVLNGSSMSAESFKPLFFQASWVQGRPKYVARMGRFAILLDRNKGLHGNDAGEGPAGISLVSGRSCEISQDGWFSKSGFWLRNDEILLAYTLSSAGDSILRIIDTRSCKITAAAGLPGADSIFLVHGGIGSDGVCGKVRDYLFYCNPSIVWRVSLDGSLQVDGEASMLRTLSKYGVLFSRPSYLFKAPGASSRILGEDEVARLEDVEIVH